MPDVFQAEDIFLYQEVADLNCAPNEALVACQLQSTNQEGQVNAIWLLPLDGGAPTQFTSGPSDTSPRWSPDGSQLAFLSSRGSGRQIFLISRSGGEAQQLSKLPAGASEFEWAPDGKSLLAVCAMTVDPNIRGDHGKPQNTDLPPDAPQLAWRLPYKLDGVGYLLNSEIHVFAVDAVSGEHKQLTQGAFEVRSASFSPDSGRIAYSRTREGRRAHRTDIWIMEADGSNQRQLSHDIATMQYPRWSPDGKRIIFTGSRAEGDAQLRLWQLDFATDRIQAFGDEDIEVASGQDVRFTEDGSRLRFVLARHGRQEIASIGIADGKLERLVTGNRQIGRLSFSKTHMVFSSEDPSTPADVYVTDHGGHGERKLSDFNSWWRERIVPEFVVRWFEVPNGEGGTERVEGWLLRPPGAQEATPLLVDVHGGPASYAFVSFAWRAYWPMLVSRGWSVLALNPVGSSSYGRPFCARLQGRWGELDLPQHLAAVDTLQAEGLVDERIAIAGKSYGGYLGAWAIGHTGRFRAAVISAPVSNLESHFSNSDSGYYTDSYMLLGPPWEQRERTRKLSPIQHVHHATTPTLILQGENDQRCPRSQAEELFTTLMSATETPAEMVIYPGGGHHFFESGKPSHRVDMLVRTLDWLERWARIDAVAAAKRRDANP